MQSLAEARFLLPGFPDRELSKSDLERVHLDRYGNDFESSEGKPPFDAARTGDDPPDFVLTARGLDTGVDCAVFADPKRRQAWALFDRLFERLREGAAGRNFDNLLGCGVNIWFGEDLVTLPPRASDSSLIEPLLDAMEACQVDRNATDPAGPPPAPWVHLPGGAGFSVDLLPLPGTSLTLQFNSDYTEGDARRILDNLVGSHDQPVIDHLLITAGGPDRRGWIYTTEESAASFLLEHDSRLHTGGVGVPTQHLKQITIHFWSTGRIVSVPTACR